MEIIETALSFLISYITGNVPSIKDLLGTNDSLEKKLKQCFKKTVKDWNVDSETKKNAKDNFSKHLIDLKEFLSHTPKERLPKEYELLKLWADYIISDTDCNAFILLHRQAIIQMDIQRGFQRAKNILSALKSDIDEEFQRVQEKLDRLLKRGVTSCTDYWDRYSIFFTENVMQLPQSIILCGREDNIPKIKKVCNNPSLLNIEAKTQKESLAFACAAVLSLGKNYSDRAYVVRDSESYKELSDIDKPLIIITNLEENHSIVVKKGHSVLYCVSHHDGFQNTVKLGELNREGFIEVLTETGYDEAKARTMARDTSRDINYLWREVGITQAYAWEDNRNINIRLLIPAMLLGGWNESVKNDCEIVSKMSGQSYDEYIRELRSVNAAGEPLLTEIGGIWKIRAPYNLMRHFFSVITEGDIKTFLECADWLIEDDDPDALDKMDADSLKLWKNKRAFSDTLRGGVFQGITLLALLQEENRCSSELIRNYFKQKLDSFDLVRYLSNRNYIQLVAEAVPLEFLSYIQLNMRNDSTLLKEIFEVRQKYDMFGTIYYAELLFCLENLAWDEQYLPYVTDILLYLCRYSNENNWGNSPFNSLMNIYQFCLPQTYTAFDQRIDILQDLSKKYPNEVRILCFKELTKISLTTFSCTSQFKWRWMERQCTPKHIEQILAEHIQKVVDLMLQLTSWTNDNICEYLELSFNNYMCNSRNYLLTAILEHKDKMKGNEQIVETLRKNINMHRSYGKTKCALNDEKIRPYVTLLSEIESGDIVIRNMHCFDELFLEGLNPDDGYNYEKIYEATLQRRVSIIDEVIKERGVEGVFQLSQLSKHSDDVAEALIIQSNGNYTNEIYNGFIDASLPEQFVRSYFFHLYLKIEIDSYLTICNKLLKVSENHIAIVLYAPRFKPELSALAESLGDLVYTKYWNSVTISKPLESDIPLIQMRLKSVGRYEDLLHLMTHGSIVNAFSTEDKVSLLIEMFQAGLIENMIRNTFLIAMLLKSIDLPMETVQRNAILQIEFLMYNHLRHRMHGESLHLVKEIQSSPELLIALVELYPPDKEFCQEKDSNVSNPNKVEMARLASNFFYHFHSVPGLQPNGKLDYTVLNEYIDHLQELAIAHHRVHIMPMIIGKMIGNIPESENYPSVEMCELIEKLANDQIDDEIRCAIANKRGMSLRSPFEGGTIERKHIETLDKYRGRAFGKSQRMVEILSNVIRSFEARAKQEDEESEITKLEY